MYVESPEAAKKLASGLRKRARTYEGVDARVAPSYPLLPLVAALLKGSQIKVGAQAASAHTTAARTGEVSAAMLKASGATFVLVGHSERRALGDSNELVRAQMAAALSAGLTVILCVGEVEQDSGGAHFEYVTEQLTSALRGVQSFASKIIVAYEPVWAIGKSAEFAMDPGALEEMVIFIRKTLVESLGRTVALKVPILYGGSVEPANAASLIKSSGASGLLVGHASAEVDSFIEILKACK